MNDSFKAEFEFTRQGLINLGFTTRYYTDEEVVEIGEWVWELLQEKYFATAVGEAMDEFEAEDENV